MYLLRDKPPGRKMFDNLERSLYMYTNTYIYTVMHMCV